jgi:hypothetical protein
MLPLSGGERFPPLDLSPQRKKERTFAALLRQLQALAQQSARAADRAVAYSRELGHAHTLAHALYFAGNAAVFARDVATVCAYGNDCVALASEHGFALWAAIGRILQGLGRRPKR